MVTIRIGGVPRDNADRLFELIKKALGDTPQWESLIYVLQTITQMMTTLPAG